MPYRELRKIYYDDQSLYKEEYERRFLSEEAVKLDFEIGKKQAFFLENAEVYQLAYHISKLNQDVNALSRALPRIAKQQYSKKCLIDEIVLTNNIEGVHSSRKEIGEALEILEQQSKQKKRHTRFYGLVKRYQMLVTKDVLPLNSCEDIRKIYDEVFLEEVVAEDPTHAPDGVLFRKDMATVYSAAGKAIHNGLMPESKIIDALNQALAFLKDPSVEVLFRICIFHYLFEYIHPFYDGNGRMGRLILSYCISENLEPLLAYRISETIKEHVNEYYSAFKACNDPKNLGDLTPFLIMQLNMVKMSISELKDSLSRRLFQLERYVQMIPQLVASNNEMLKQIYYCLIQAALFSEQGISTAELLQNLKVSYNTLRKALNKIPAEMMISETKAHKKYYQMNLELLEEMMMKSGENNSNEGGQ